MTTERNGVEIDTSRHHPGVVFIQDVRTRATVAIDVADGTPFGAWGIADLPASHALWREVDACQDERVPRRDGSCG